MKIGILSQYRERTLTGIPKVVAGTVSELKKIANKEDFFFVGEEDYLPCHLPGVPVPYAGWEEYHLDFALDEIKPDVIHSFYYAFRYDDYICKKILTIHDLAHVVHPEWFFETSNDYFNKTLKNCAKRMDVIVAVSENTKRDIVYYYDIPEERIEVIPNGLYPKPKYDVDINIDLKTKISSEDYIFSVSAFHEYKNQKRLLKAYEIFRERNRDITPKLVLSGPIRKDLYLESIIEDSDIRNDVIFTGYVSEDELAWLYQNALLTCYVSLFEGFGLPVLEAMGYGSAVVCSDTTSIPEVGGNAVCYCNPYDEDSIASSIEVVVRDNNLRNKLKKDGKKRSALFSYEKTAHQLMKIYRVK